MTIDRKIFPDFLASKFKGCGKKYRPSNGSEGMIFMALWCDCCAKNENDKDGYCQIVGETMRLDHDDPEYPPEWCFDGEGQPQCTAFTEEGIELVVNEDQIELPL
jgi:hypothetical protein